MISNKVLRKPLLKKVDSMVYDKLMNRAGCLKSVSEKKYQYLKAMIACTERNYNKGYISKSVLKKVLKTLVANAFSEGGNASETINAFEKKHGIKPPTFLVFAPSIACNLRCVGCYAAVGKDTPATLTFDEVSKVMEEAHSTFGNRFMTITGGEPFIYKSQGKTLFDIWEKYNDMFFLVYTNGTFITPEVAQRLAKLGNVTPAISVEGWEKETDERRGQGIFKKILEAMKNLREAGVPFGISVTATDKNIPVLLDDKFYEFFFQEQGVSYMWQFQLMPVGKGRDVMQIMVKPEDRVKLYKKWEYLLGEKQYCIADFWNCGALANGCIAYGRNGGYLHVGAHGHITPCAFTPYYVDNIRDLWAKGKGLTDALFSDFFRNGRKWQQEYGLTNQMKPSNWICQCSIRDHYKNFKYNICTPGIKPENQDAADAMNDPEYEKIMIEFDRKLAELSDPIWEKEYVKKG